MIQTEDGELVVTCDECEEEEFGGTLEFKEFLAHIRRLGWTYGKVEDVWEHHCPDCPPVRWK